MNKKKIIVSLIILAVVGIIGTVLFKIFIYDGIINSPERKLLFDNDGWKYDKKNNVYYKIGVEYVMNPSSNYELLNVYVPGDYLTCSGGKDNIYDCKINSEGNIRGYTATTAPIIMPVISMGYVAQKAPESYIYSNVAKYMLEGFIYVYSGFRGRSNEDGITGGAPWGVTDLKAAIRYLKYNDERMVGDAKSIFLYGHSSGGALASIVGASGDSELYIPYLEKLGAIMKDTNNNPLSDTIRGVMAWCPTLLDYVNEAYEWNMGQYTISKTRFKNTWTSVLSEDMANAFATYINEIKLKDINGNTLALSKTDDGIYNAGTYYFYIKEVIEKSLLNYLLDNYENKEDMQKYINRFSWASLDTENMVVTIADIESFIKEMKTPNKNVPAYDFFNRTRAENSLFGTETEDSLHWDNTLYNILKINDESYKVFKNYVSYVKDFEEDLNLKDSLGNDSQVRQNMYNPLYYLIDYYDGFEKTKVAPNWRIRTGIKQTDTPLTTEVNLYLALMNYGGLNVDFATIWNKTHTQAESIGDATGNFISWVIGITRG